MTSLFNIAALLLLFIFRAVDVDAAAEKNITLRGGVIIAPPFALYDDANDIYTGFQGDFLRRLQIFALDDGYNLNFELEHSPYRYGPALDLIANDCNTTDNPHPLD